MERENRQKTCHFCPMKHPNFIILFVTVFSPLWIILERRRSYITDSFHHHIISGSAENEREKDRPRSSSISNHCWISNQGKTAFMLLV